MVIHTAAYEDGSRGRRSVAHRLSFVEMVVPYGDPKDPHYRKNAFDAGEDGLGKNCHSLKRVSALFFTSGPFNVSLDTYGLRTRVRNVDRFYCMLITHIWALLFWVIFSQRVNNVT